jgi:DNA-binding transcriptional ArsR family regulator
MLGNMQVRTSTSDRVFHALGDATRRAIVVQLGSGPASVTDLARPLPVSLAAVVQHVQVLEASGLVATRKQGRVRTCQLVPAALLEAERWLAQRRALWEGRLDRLESLILARPPVDDAPDDEPTTARSDTPPDEEGT